MGAWKYDISVVGGLGHVGLPFGIALAQVGKKVVLIDINETAIEAVSQGKMPFVEEGAEPILRRVLEETLLISPKIERIAETHFVVVVIGTPVDEHLNPQFTGFKDLLASLLPFLRDDQHIILRSTLYPGTTDKMRQYLRSRGKQTKISYCPERIAQGTALEELRTLPQIIASFDDESLAEARELFSALTDELVELRPIEAELAKLYTNVWRYIQFSVANQFYQIAAQHGLDFYKIHDAVTYKYPRAQGFPRAGFTAGPCLFKDTMQLAAFSNNNFFLGHAAMLINEGLPNFLVQQLKERYPLGDMSVGILGMAYKGNSDDKRESLSYKLKKILEIEAKEVLCSDVYIREEGFVSANTVIERADVIIVGALHREYADLRIGPDKVVVDVWNFFGNGGRI
jgi:UDP-N-acetyl-D-mannosaminuronic acid dehydrogenase